MAFRSATLITTVTSVFASFLIATTPINAEGAVAVRSLDRSTRLPGGLGALPEVVVDPANAKKAELGRFLFFDKRLSGDRQTSCATCHKPEKGFADGLPTAIGFGGKVLGRHTPTVLNAAYNDTQFWDGRAKTLEEQAVGPITSADEMNLGDEKELVSRLSEVTRYRKLFSEAFAAGPSRTRVAQAIAAYERTLTTRNSRFDRYALGDKGALTLAEKRGLLLFVGKAACSQCHLGPNFTDNTFHNIGLSSPAGSEPDLGRYAVTGDAASRGAFKTPTLRNTALTAPFMHDGSMSTLEDVIDYYDKGGNKGIATSDRIFELGLTSGEKRDLLAFFQALTGSAPDASAPDIPR